MEKWLPGKVPTRKSGSIEEKIKLPCTRAKESDILREQREKRNKGNCSEVFPKADILKLGKFSRANPWSGPIFSQQNVDFL